MRNSPETKIPGVNSAAELAIKDVRDSNNITVTDGDNYVTLAMGSLYFQSIPWPYTPSDTDAYATKKRQSNHITVSGVKIHRYFSYEVENPSDIGPLVINWCLIQARNDVNTSELASALTNNTYRFHGSINNETLDHQNYGASTPWRGEMNFLPLNPDNKFKILVHKRNRIYPRSSTSAVGHPQKWNPTWLWEIRKWYKLGKTFSFESANNVEPQKNIYELFWYNTTTDDKFPANPIGTNYITSWRHNLTYYHDQQ